jgi:hypothetical protein
MISVYPFGDELYALTEYPVIHRFDPITLDTLDRVSDSAHSQSCKTNVITKGHHIFYFNITHLSTFEVHKTVKHIKHTLTCQLYVCHEKY